MNGLIFRRIMMGVFMNEQINDLMYRAGLTAQGCWDSMDDYDRDAILKFAELIIQDVMNLFGDERISLHYLEQSCCEDSVYLLQSKIKEHFGIK